jgi:hypothetical protein
MSRGVAVYERTIARSSNGSLPNNALAPREMLGLKPREPVGCADFAPSSDTDEHTTTSPSVSLGFFDAGTIVIALA